MKKVIGCVTVLLGVSAICALSYYALTFAVAGIVAEKLPEPLKTIAWEWILGDAKQVGHPGESDIHPTYPGEVVEGGSYYWSPVFYSGPESFRCALPVASGYLTSSYGDMEGRSRAHTGIDYGTYGKPTDIYAPTGGMVTHAGWSYWLGWTVVIENDGWQTILGHPCCGESGKRSTPSGPSSILVDEGDIIEAGAVLGQTGDTGNSTGVHLHFEVRKCDEDGSCRIRDPNSVFLSGQSSYCAWEVLGGKR